MFDNNFFGGFDADLMDAFADDYEEYQQAMMEMESNAYLAEVAEAMSEEAAEAMSEEAAE